MHFRRWLLRALTGCEGQIYTWAFRKSETQSADILLMSFTIVFRVYYSIKIVCSSVKSLLSVTKVLLTCNRRCRPPRDLTYYTGVIIISNS